PGATPAITFTGNAPGCTSTLSGAINNTATTLTVSDGILFPATDFQIIIDSETIHVATRTGNILSGLTRGVAGTTAAAHSSGATVNAGVFACVQLPMFIGTEGSQVPIDFLDGNPGAGGPFLDNILRAGISVNLNNLLSGSGTAFDFRFVPPNWGDFS